MLLLWHPVATGVAPPAQAESFSGGWFPHQRIKTKEEIRKERIELGILPPDVVEEVLPVIEAAPKARRKIVLSDLVGKKASAEVSAVDIEVAVQAFRRRARQRREDEELLLLH